jgi:hypothetical protein
MLEEKFAELREENIRCKNFQLSMPVMTHLRDRVKNSGVGKTCFSEEFLKRENSLTLD